MPDGDGGEVGSLVPQPRSDLVLTAVVGRSDDVRRRLAQARDLPRKQCVGERRLRQVEDTSAPAAAVGVAERDEYRVRDRRKEPSRRVGDLLPVEQMTGIRVDDPDA